MADGRGSIGPAGIRLLKQLAFRAPDPCFLVDAARGHVALVVTTMMGTLCRSAAYKADTIHELDGAHLVELGDFQDVPAYNYGKPGDTRRGYTIAITEAGRARIAPRRAVSR